MLNKQHQSRGEGDRARALLDCATAMELLLLLTRGEWVVLLCVLTMALYVSPLLLLNPANDWHFILQYDDSDNFVTNPILQSGFLFSYENLYAMATMRKIGVYEPLSWLLKAMIIQCAGMDSRVVRMVTVVMHCGVGWLLVRVSVLLIEISDLLATMSEQDIQRGPQANRLILPGDRKYRPKTDPYFLGCYLSALLFLVHPIHVEVVAWPSAQPYTQAALFANVSLLIYVQNLYLDLQSMGVLGFASPCLRNGPRRSDWLVAGLYLGSVLSKSMTVLLPAAFVLVDLLVMQKLHSSHPVQLSPKALLTYVSSKAPVLFVMLSFIGVTIWSNIGSSDVFILSLSKRILKVLMVPAWTMSHIMWPTKLRAHYQIHEDSLSLANPECVICIVALVLFSMASGWLWKQHQTPQLLLGIAFFMAMSLPTSGLVQHGVVSQGCDRYAYFPSAVLVPFGGFLLGKYVLDDQDDREMKTATPSNDALLVSIADSKIRAASSNCHSCKLCQSPASHTLYRRWGFFITTLGVSTWISTVQLGTWRSERALYTHSLRMDPSDWRVYEWHVRDLLRTGVCNVDALRCRGAWELALTLSPNTTLKAKLFRSQSLFALDRANDACQMLDALVPQYPQSLPLANNIGVCRVRDGMLSEARALFYQAAYKMPTYEGAREIAVKNLEGFDAWLAKFREEHGDRAMTPEESGTFFGTIMW